jgi:hypothetical protein
MFDDYDSEKENCIWNFDTFKYLDLLGEDALVLFGMRLFLKYGLVEKFSISEYNLLNLMNEITKDQYNYYTT